MASGVKRVTICALAPDITHVLVIGVIIAKQNARIFRSKKDATERGVWGFTLRDSPADTINATFWGSSETVKKINDIFKVGDIVEVINPRVAFRELGSSAEVFNPTVSSPFHLQLQENSSDMVPHLEDVLLFKDLLHHPTKSSGDYLKLSDVLGSYGQNMKGEYVNLLVAIRNVGNVRTVKSKKDFRDLECRDIVVFDNSEMEFHVTLWSEEIIQRAESWRPRHTTSVKVTDWLSIVLLVLFFSDLKLDWSTFKRCITASVTSRTIITENPNTEEAKKMQKYAMTVPIQPVDLLYHLANNISDPNTINVVMTTAQVLEKAYSGSSPGSQFTALLYVVVTHLDLDGLEDVISKKCSRCFSFVDNLGICLNMECTSVGNFDTRGSFDIRVSLTDHRGTLNNCRLVSPTAEKVLQCSVSDYLGMNTEERTRLKWQLLLTRCKAHVLVLCASSDRPRPLISLLTCSPVNPEETSSRLPLY